MGKFKCPECGASRWATKGKDESGARQYQCRRCKFLGQGREEGEHEHKRIRKENSIEGEGIK